MNSLIVLVLRFPMQDPLSKPYRLWPRVPRWISADERRLRFRGVYRRLEFGPAFFLARGRLKRGDLDNHPTDFDASERLPKTRDQTNPVAPHLS